MELKIPHVTNTTSAAFGGPNLTELFVTSGGSGFVNTKYYEEAGGLYKITFTDTDIKGREMNKIDL